MIFNERSPYGYGTSMDREYSANSHSDFNEGFTGADNLEKPIGPAREKPILSVGEIGQTITEGRSGGGTFIETIQAAIRKGAGHIELAAVPGGSEPGTGVESYGV